MRYKTLSLVFSIMTSLLCAQQDGTIVYEENVDIHRRMTGDRAQFKEFVPQFRTTKMKLIFGDGKALYSAIKDDESHTPPPHGDGHGGRMMRMRMMQQNNIVFIDYQANERVEQRHFMDKKFLITGVPEKFPWKMTGDTKQVGQYTCQKATFSDSTQTIVAWFTSQIPVPLGPARFGQLPGLVLHVDINDGERTLTALEIDLGDVETSEIEKPTKGKDVTHEEFQEIVRTKMEEMGAERHGRGAFFIRH